jgi:hypothetical protein
LDFTLFWQILGENAVVGAGKIPAKKTEFVGNI